MRVFHVAPDRFTELDGLPEALPSTGFLWIGSERGEFERRIAALQEHLHGWESSQLVDLHISDLLNPQLPSHYDYTSWYDLLVFRRLTADSLPEPSPADDSQATVDSARRALHSVHTSPVGFALFDHVLLTVHPSDCAVREHFALRLAELGAAGGEGRAAVRVPGSPADLMLRMVNHMVDGYLDLRRLLTRQLGSLQGELL